MSSISRAWQAGILAALTLFFTACGVDEEPSDVAHDADATADVTDSGCVDTSDVAYCGPGELDCPCPNTGGVGVLNCCALAGATGTRVYECANTFGSSGRWEEIYDYYCGMPGTEDFPDCEPHPVDAPLPLNICRPDEGPYPDGCVADGSGDTDCACPVVGAIGVVRCCDGTQIFACGIGRPDRVWRTSNLGSCSLDDPNVVACPWVGDETIEEAP